MKRLERTGTTRRVLLVDDNKAGAPARRSALEELGLEVATVTSGADALEQFAATPFDLVVTDYKMPKMNGIELIAALRAERPNLLIVLLSGFAEAGGLTEASTGANVVLQKGHNECNQLVRTVNRLLFHRAGTARKPASRASAAAAAASSSSSGSSAVGPGTGKNVKGL